MDKKIYQVFISSSFHEDFDLGFTKEREYVKKLINDASDAYNLKDISLDAPKAYSQSTKDKSLQRVEQADVVILFIGTRYGSIRENGKSLTELEYEKAKQCNKPILAYIFPTDETYPDSDKVEEFKETVINDDYTRSLDLRELYKDKYTDVLDAKSKKVTKIDKKRIDEFCHSFSAQLLAHLIEEIGRKKDETYQNVLSKFKERLEKEKQNKKILTSVVFILVTAFVPFIIFVFLYVINELNKENKQARDHYSRISEQIDSLTSKYTPIDLKSFNKEIATKLNEAEMFIDNHDYGKAIQIYDDVLKSENKLTDENRVALYRQRVIAYHAKQDWEKVKEASVKLLAFIEKKHQKQFYLDSAFANKYMGIAFYRLGDYKLAREKFEEAEIYYKKYYQKANIDVLWMRNWRVETYEAEKSYKLEKDLLEKTLPLVKELESDAALSKRREFSYFYSHLGYVNEKLGLISDAIKYYQISIKWYENINSHLDLAWIYRRIAHIYKQDNKYNKAIQNYQYAIKIYKKYKKFSELGKIYKTISYIYRKLEKNELMSSINALKESCAFGNADSCYELGNIFREQNNIHMATQYYKIAAEKDYALAQEELADIYYDKETFADYKEAFYWYDKAAQKNMPWSAYMIGIMYKNGEGTIRDLNSSVVWLKRANKLGSLNAADILGDLYFEGKYIKQNINKALFYYREGTEGNITNSILSLAFMYENGIGVNTDIETSYSLYYRAYKLGEKQVAYKLAEFYLNDSFSEKNISKAIEILEKSKNDCDCNKLKLAEIYTDQNQSNKSALLYSHP